MVLAEDAVPIGSGNADSQRKVRSSGWGGQGRRFLRDSGCVPAHPASWRASASYRPLRAVWAVCAWALRGCARSKEPRQRSNRQRTSYKEVSHDHCQQVRQGPRHHIRHHPARRRAMPGRHHDVRGKARDRRDARRHGRRRHRGRFPDHLRRRFPGRQRDRPPLQEFGDRRPVARASEGHRPLRRGGEIRPARPRPHRDRDLAAAHARQAEHDAGAGDRNSRSPTSPAPATRSTTSNGRPRTAPAARWTTSAASSKR